MIDLEDVGTQLARAQPILRDPDPAAQHLARVMGSSVGPTSSSSTRSLGHSYPSCHAACADYIPYMIDHAGNVAAVMMESVVGTNGVLVPDAATACQQRVAGSCKDVGPVSVLLGEMRLAQRLLERLPLG